MESAEGSLKRLDTDYVDVYLAHRFDYSTPLEETLKAFDDLVRQGKVLYIGVSEWTSSEISSALLLAREMGFERIIVNEPQYNMIWRVIEEEVVPLCSSEGVGLLAWSPLAQGVLTGKYLSSQHFPAGSRAADVLKYPFIEAYLSDLILSRVSMLRSVAAQEGLSMAQLAIAWVLGNTSVSSAIIGGSRPQHIRENALASGKVLDPGTRARVEEALGPVIVRDPAETYSPAERP
jgi:aryl-alcohol dehydrogenase-like predicted oxidoreductase